MTKDKVGFIEEKFILNWGEMGSRWGINRTVAQIHALLYLSEGPLTAEDIGDQLGVARSNVSTGMRELLQWGVVRTVQVMGDRRNYYEAVGDVWQMFRFIIGERKRRELDPILSAISEINDMVISEPGTDKHTRKRVADMHEMFRLMDSFYTQLNRLPEKQFQSFMKFCTNVNKVLAVV